MNLLTLVRFQFGHAAAIRTVAQNSAALPFAIALVLLTAIARNYDQSFITESPMWLIGPLVFSFFSGSFLYGIVHRGFTKNYFPKDPKPGGQWIRFMTLFWMTAPVAWLYAIPTERLFDSYRAAQANITLLMVVSLWRVLLMSRIVSVMNRVPFTRALLWVLLGASIEVIIVGFFGVSFSMKLAASMGGMRNSPEEDLIGSAVGTAWAGALIVIVALALVLALWGYRETTRPFPQRTFGRVPWLGLLFIAGLWIAVAWPAQLKQHRFLQHRNLLASERYAEALAFLDEHKLSSFPAGRRVEPNPYEYNVWKDLPPTVALLTSNTSPWIRELYLDHLTRTLAHRRPSYESVTNIFSMYAAVERLPEGVNWMRTNQSAIVNQGHRWKYVGRRDREIDDALIVQTNIFEIFQRMGMSESNLAHLRRN